MLNFNTVELSRTEQSKLENCIIQIYVKVRLNTVKYGRMRYLSRTFPKGSHGFCNPLYEKDTLINQLIASPFPFCRALGCRRTEGLAAY